jgi:hypothetical protein
MREYIKIPLREDEYETLAHIAERELRPIDMQAHFLLRRAIRAFQVKFREGKERVRNADAH